MITMRTETDGFRRNFLPDLSGISPGGRWFNFRRSSRDQAAVNRPSTTDGQYSPREEEPDNGSLTFEQILEAQQLSEASQLLIERENRLFGEIMEAEALKHHEEEVEKLAEDYKHLKRVVLQTLTQSLSPEDVEALTSAVKAMNQEEVQDQQWKKINQTSPPWRPNGWRKLHDLTVHNLVEQRIDNPLTPPADQDNQSSIKNDVHSMGKQLKEDLLLVVQVVKSCYPPEMDICNFYAQLYHQTFSARLRKIADFGLDDKDCTFLLLWVNEHYPQLLQKPELANEIDAEALGKLLPLKLLEPLEEQYLTQTQGELKTYISRILEEAERKWNKGEEPTREDGCFVSPVAFDMIQLVNGMVTSAAKVVGDQHKARNITRPLKDLMHRFRNFQDDVMKADKANSRPFIMANLGCFQQFRDVLVKRQHLFTEDVRELCLRVLNEMKQSAHAYLIKPVHEDLKPQYRKLGTSDWLKKSLMFNNLLEFLDKELQDIQGLTESCHQELMGQLHQEVTTEYVKRLLKGQVKLKDKEQQLKAYTTVKSNAESLHDLFSRRGSNEKWLKDILTGIAEVLQLQDVPAIQMQIGILGAQFPDLSEKHVLALLKLKTNLSKLDRKTVKDTLSDTLREARAVDAPPFFSTVQLK